MPQAIQASVSPGRDTLATLVTRSGVASLLFIHGIDSHGQASQSFEAINANLESSGDMKSCSAKAQELAWIRGRLSWLTPHRGTSCIPGRAGES